MTAPRGTVRPRRARAEQVPAGVADWFAGQATVEAAGWAALLPDAEADLHAWWAAWSRSHPGAAPPADAPWISG